MIEKIKEDANASMEELNDQRQTEEVEEENEERTYSHNVWTKQRITEKKKKLKNYLLQVK